MDSIHNPKELDCVSEEYSVMKKETVSVQWKDWDLVMGLAFERVMVMEPEWWVRKLG